MKAQCPMTSESSPSRTCAKRCRTYRGRVVARARDIAPVFETATAALMPPNGRSAGSPTSRRSYEVDLIVVLGGDGTLLSVADCIASAGRRRADPRRELRQPRISDRGDAARAVPVARSGAGGRANVEARMMLRATDHPRGARCRAARAERRRHHQVGAGAPDRPVGVGRRGVRHARQGRRPDHRHAHGIDRLQPVGRRSDRPAGRRRDGVDADCAAHAHQSPDRHSGVVARPGAAADDRSRRAVRHIRRTGGLRAAGGRRSAASSAPSGGCRLLRPSTRSYFEVLRQKLKWNER